MAINNVSIEYAFSRYTIIKQCCFSVSHAVKNLWRHTEVLRTLSILLSLASRPHHMENDNSTDKIIAQFIHIVLFSHTFLISKRLDGK